MPRPLNNHQRQSATKIVFRETSTDELEYPEMLEGRLLTSTVLEQDEPLQVNEVPYDSFLVQQYDVPYSDSGVGVILNTVADVAECNNFILIAPEENPGNVFIGSASDKCFIKLLPGNSKSYSLRNADLIYFYSTDSGGGDKIIIEFYDPVAP